MTTLEYVSVLIACSVQHKEDTVVIHESWRNPFPGPTSEKKKEDLEIFFFSTDPLDLSNIYPQ